MEADALRFGGLRPAAGPADEIPRAMGAKLPCVFVQAGSAAG